MRQGRNTAGAQDKYAADQRIQGAEKKTGMRIEQPGRMVR